MAKQLPKIATMRLDADRPFLEQFEEEALLDDSGQALEWLEENVYQRPEIMSVLTPIRPANPDSIGIGIPHVNRGDTILAQFAMQARDRNLQLIRVGCSPSSTESRSELAIAIVCPD